MTDIETKKCRLAKWIAAHSTFSRRQAELLIKEKAVKVNGQQVNQSVFLVNGTEHIQINEIPLSTSTVPRLWRYYKPRGLIVSRTDPQHRTTIFENLPKGNPRWISVGRLDIESEGLLLLTNSGTLAHFFELPSSGWKRIYRVRVFGKISENKLRLLEKGITLNGIQYRPCTIDIEHQRDKHAWLILILSEGKNREIRLLLNSIGLEVSRLIRTAYGPFQLETLAPSQLAEVPDHHFKKFIKPPSY